MPSKILLYSKSLSNQFNSQIYLKPEWYKQTGSHKDRWAKEIIKIILKKKINKVVTMSSGNQGLALAAEAKKYNIECVVLAQAEISKKYDLLFQKYKAKLIRAKSLKERSAKLNLFIKMGYFPCSLTLNQRKTKNTIGINGYQEISKEIVASLKKQVDIIIIPTGYGDLAKGIFNGFLELKKTNKIIKIPQFILVRAKKPKGNVAFSIANNILTKYVKEILKKSNGKSIFLLNKDFIEAQKSLKKELNLNLEYASAGPVLALKKLNKEIIKGKTIVLILTALER